MRERKLKIFFSSYVPENSARKMAYLIFIDVSSKREMVFDVTTKLLLEPVVVGGPGYGDQRKKTSQIFTNQKTVFGT